MPRTRTPAQQGEKHCHACDKAKPLMSFARDASKSDGLRAKCRDCDARRLKKRYWTKERLKARKLRRQEAKRRQLEHAAGGPHIFAQQERERLERERLNEEAELRARREHSMKRFFASVRARSKSNG
jgi:hypothetical protein